ncbi:MAG TPA: hypothetical protein VM553_02905 [Dongiaceae bacterium]|nr:hypothetical protein [Dongiaceae bacterium]
MAAMLSLFYDGFMKFGCGLRRSGVVRVNAFRQNADSMLAQMNSDCF